MRLYHCRLTFHDNLFYETRTMGRLYETGRLLHNIALCYALGFAVTPYHHQDFVPNYAQELAAVNAAGVYVTPATGIEIYYSLNTFKLGEERTAARMEKSNLNKPTYGRAKEIGVGSIFEFGILSETALVLPHWIRMGLWLSKARLEVVADIELRSERQAAARTVSIFPLNPGDLPPQVQLRVFDLVSMRPSSLVENALVEAETWWTGRLADNRVIWLPMEMSHRVS